MSYVTTGQDSASRVEFLIDNPFGCFMVFLVFCIICFIVFQDWILKG
jgi:hypothetical protein